MLYVSSELQVAHGDADSCPAYSRRHVAARLRRYAEFGVWKTRIVDTGFTGGRLEPRLRAASSCRTLCPPPRGGRCQPGPMLLRLSS